MNGIIETEWDVWDEEKSGDIESTIFNSIYALSEESFQGMGYNEKCDKRINTIRDHALAKVIGVYCPPKGRAFYTNTVDLRSDSVGDIFTVSGPKRYFDLYSEAVPADFSSWSFYRIKSIPRQIKMPRHGRFYKAIHWSFYIDGCPGHLGLVGGVKEAHISIFTAYLSVSEGETVCVAFDKRGVSPFTVNRGIWEKMFCIANSAYADRKHLWNVAVPYEVMEGVKTWVMFGVHEEHIKSLLYAREAPTTASGRKRPIQHWVSSHSRRLQKGVNVDIGRHLRGVSDFKMFDFDMKIVSPNRRDNSSLDQYENRATKFLATRQAPRCAA